MRPAGSGRHAVRGTLVIRRRAGQHDQVVSEEKIELPPGKRVYSIRQEVDQVDSTPMKPSSCPTGLKTTA